jgi:L-asparaginase
MASGKQTIHFIITGGTIDSFYDGTRDTVVPNKKSVIPDFVKSLKLHEKIEFTEVCMKDSRSLTRTDLINILKKIQKSPHNKIIITHGTYTIPDTARYLKANLKRDDQTIVFTGSLIPLVGFSPSDASFNLGYSIAKVQDLPNGIYVCMNGKVFEPDEVTKLIYEGRFVSIFGERK